MAKRVLLSWSSGKDSAWTLHVLRQQWDVEVVGLLTTFNEAADRVAMHAVRHALVDAQASAAGLPLWPVLLPWPCSNADYQQRMSAVISHARDEGITHVAFGDLFLEDVRNYRIRQMSGTGIEPLFPLWRTPADTPNLARRMLEGGLRAVVTCVDPRQLPEPFVGRPYDAALLADLPPGVDPCGERGEFHTFCFGGPMFAFEIAVQVGETVSRDGFCFADLVPDTSVVNSHYRNADPVAFAPRRIELPAHVRVDAGGEFDAVPASGARPGLALTFRVENLLDARYEEVLYFRVPGRVALLGARATSGR